MTLEPHQAADEIDKLAHAILVLDSALDRLWPKLPYAVMTRLTAVALLEKIDRSLADELTAIAEIIREEDASVLEHLVIIDGSVAVPHLGEIH